METQYNIPYKHSIKRKNKQTKKQNRIINQPLQNRKTGNMTEKQLHLFKRKRNQIQMKPSERTRNGWDGKKCVCCTCPALKQNPPRHKESHPHGGARQRMGGMSGRCHQHCPGKTSWKTCGNRHHCPFQEKVGSQKGEWVPAKHSHGI